MPSIKFLIETELFFMRFDLIYYDSEYNNTLIRLMNQLYYINRALHNIAHCIYIWIGICLHIISTHII